MMLALLLLFALCPVDGAHMTSDDAGCFLPKDFTEWQLDVQQQQVDVIWNNMTSCHSVRTCYSADEDRQLLKQMTPLQLQSHIDIRFLIDANESTHIEIHQVSEDGFARCDVTSVPLGVVTGRLPILVNRSTVVVSRDRLRHHRSSYFIGVIVAEDDRNSSLLDGGELCSNGLRLNVTITTNNCSSPSIAGLCNSRGRCALRKYLDETFGCICCAGYSGQYCSDADVSREDINDGSSISANKTSSNDVSDCRTNCSTDSPLADGNNVTASASTASLASATSSEELLCQSSVICLNNGTCVPFVDSSDLGPNSANRRLAQRCVCPSGWTGDRCERRATDAEKCLSGPCVNGICAAQEGSDVYRCYCVPGYGGERCELSYSACLSSPCRNDAICRDSDQMGFICECSNGYTGVDCSIQNIDRCEPNPCAHVCLDYGQYFMCECNPGYTGERCEFEIDECLSNPCHHGGHCVDGVATYRCQCQLGYHGVHCEIHNFTSDWSLFMTSHGSTGRLRNWTTAVGTLTGALLIAAIIILTFYCKIHGVFNSVGCLRRLSYDSQLEDLVPADSSTGQSRDSAGGGRTRCLVRSVQSLLRAAAEAARFDSRSGTDTSPKSPLVVTVSSSSPVSSRRSHRRRQDIAETAVTVDA